MSQALYRKWRPARFDEVVGQEHVTRTLQNGVAAGRVGHAFLFSGPRGTGKTTSARLLAKAVNCLDPDPARRPCNQCRVCLAINDGRFLDLIEIDAASNTGVDDIRSLRDKINFAPSEGRFKVYIIDEVHMLSMAAFNALLKTLEEPPPHAKFVLATTEEHKVPVTIKSRCQVFQFRLLSLAEIVERLRWLVAQEGLEVEEEALLLIARQGAGSVRDAESLLDQLITTPGDTITLERAQKVLGTAPVASMVALTEAWIQADGAAGLQVIHQALAAGADVRQFARQMVAFLRGLLLLQASGAKVELELPAHEREQMVALAERVSRAGLIEAIKAFNEAANAPSTNWPPQLPLELAFVQLLPAAAVPAARPTPPQPAAPPPVAAEAKAAPYRQAEMPAAAPPASQAVTPLQAAAPPATTASAPATILDLAWVQAGWLEIRNLVGQEDRNLSALLASCKPLATEGQTLILGFDFPILKEKFDKNPRAVEIVAETLSRMAALHCNVRTVVSSQYRPPAVSKDEFRALADELGGVVREKGT